MGKRRPHLHIAIGLALLTAAVCSRALCNDFVSFDDRGYVTDNPHVLEGLTPQSIWWSFTTGAMANWHPLTWLSLQADAQFFGFREPGTWRPTSTVQAWGFHLTNVLLHTASTVLLFLTLVRMTGATWRSAVVAGLFALHPLNAEPVAWIAERKGTLSTLFWMLTLLAYSFYVRRPTGLNRLATAGCLVLGLLAKPMLVTLPFALLLLDYWPLGRLDPWRPRSIRGPLLEKVPLFAIAAGGCWLAWVGQSHGGALRDLEQFPLGSRMANALVSYWAYLGQAFYPHGLEIYYPHPVGGTPAWQAVLAAAALAAATVLALALSRRHGYVGVGWLWYLGTLVPVLELVQVGGHARADRYTYIPLIGIWVLVVWGVADLARSLGVELLARLLAWAALAACACLMWLQLATWQDGTAAWRHAVAVDPENWFAHEALARDFEKRGDLEAAKAHYRETLRIKPDDLVAHNNLGNLYSKDGRLEEAIAEYREVIRLDAEGSMRADEECNIGLALARVGRYGEAIASFKQALQDHPSPSALPLLENCLGKALEKCGRTDEALAHYRRAIAARPELGQAHYNLGVLLAARGHPEEAAAELRTAVRWDPRLAAAYHRLAMIELQRRQLGEAIQHLQTAASLAPAVAEYQHWLAYALGQAGHAEAARLAYRNALRLDPRWPDQAAGTAWRLATSPRAADRDGTQAVALAQQACEATGHQDPRLLDVLAAAYAEAGRFSDAAAVARQALDRTQDHDQKNLILSHLRCYLNRLPFREAPKDQTI